jgi:hypothetical protein
MFADAAGEAAGACTEPPHEMRTGAQNSGKNAVDLIFIRPRGYHDDPEKDDRKDFGNSAACPMSLEAGAVLFNKKKRRRKWSSTFVTAAWGCFRF